MRLTRLASLLAGAAAIAIAPRPAAAQTIAGVVVDSATRQPLHLVAVRVLNDSGLTIAHTRTDTAGVFYALLVTGGAYRVHFALDSLVGAESDVIRVSNDDVVQRRFVVSLERTYTEREVSKQASTAVGSAMPRYPASLKQEGIEGQVMVHFVIGTDGRADMRTFRVLSSTHALFTDAVLDVVPRMRFVPAEIDGRKVRVVVEQPFGFALSR